MITIRFFARSEHSLFPDTLWHNARDKMTTFVNGLGSVACPQSGLILKLLIL
jgi:hypothetical protein